MDASRRNLRVGAAAAVGDRRHGVVLVARRARPSSLRPLGRARRRPSARDEPLHGPVVAAGTRLHDDGRAQPRRHAAAPAGDGAWDTTGLGAVRPRVRGRDGVAPRSRGSSSSCRMACSRISAAGASCRTACSRSPSCLALGVTWAAQLAMRSGDGSVIAWITYPTPEVAARAVLDVSGATGFGLALALVGLVVLWRRARRRCPSGSASGLSRRFCSRSSRRSPSPSISIATCSLRRLRSRCSEASR